MDVGQGIVVGAAVVIVAVAYVRWIRERLDHPRGRLAPDRDMFLLVAPIAIATLAVGAVFWSWQTAAGFGFLALYLRLMATNLIWVLRDIRRRQPVDPEDRQRRIEARAARRRARAVAIERYGLEAAGLRRR
jgi:fatty acid desaturase